MIITVAHTKGGVGKSTLAWNLAHCLKRKGEPVTIIDLDFQQTLYFINQIRVAGGLKRIDVFQPQTVSALIELFEKWQGYLIVDVGGFDNDINRTAISWADKVLIPISNSVTEVLGFKTFEGILSEIDNPFINVVLNNIHPLTRNFDVITEAIGSKQNVKMLDSIIRNRKVYKDSLGVGKSVFETNNKLAIDEIQGLCDELTSD